MTENFPKLISDTKTTDPGRSENTKQDKCQTNKKTKTHTQDILFKIKDKLKNPGRGQRRKIK